MRKNVAGQHIAAQMNALTGTALSSAVTAYYSLSGGTQTLATGTLTHLGNGTWDLAPSAGETNSNHIVYTFIHATGVTTCVNVYPTAYDPTNTANLGLTDITSIVSVVATVKVDTASLLTNVAAVKVDTASTLTNVAAVKVDTASTLVRVTSVQVDTTSMLTRVPAALTNGMMSSHVASMAAGVVTVTAAPNLDTTITSRASAVAVTATLASIATNVTTINVATASLLTRVDVAVSTRAEAGGSMTLTAAAVDSILDDVVEGTLTMRQMLRLIIAAVAGEATGGGTATISYRDQADLKDRIVLTVDVDGNRSAVVVDGT